MEEEVETCQITQEPLFVCGCAHVCVKQNSAMWSWFGLHGRRRFLLSHLHGKRKHSQKEQGCQGRFIHSLHRSFGTLTEGTFCSRGMSQPHLVSSVPVAAKQSPRCSSLGPFTNLPRQGWIRKPGLSQLWQSKAGLSPAIQSFLLSPMERAPTPLP